MVTATFDKTIGLVESKLKDEPVWQFNCVFTTFELARQFVSYMQEQKGFSHMEFRASQAVMFNSIFEDV